MEKYEKVICTKGMEECPYKKAHCCLCEIDVNSLRDDSQLSIKHKCKLKNGLMVIGTIAA